MFRFLFAILFVPLAAAGERISFDTDWRFARFGPMPDGSVAAEPVGLEQPVCDDEGWRHLDLPHDWGIEGPFREDLPNRTGKLPWAGIGWYRKTFELPADLPTDQRVFVDFDGAMSDATIWLNGEQVGRWAYGYTSFRVELTRALNRDGPNVLAVRLHNRPESSRWYPGGGIYRHVWLETADPVGVAHHGVFVHTPEVSDERAVVAIEVEIENRERRYVDAETRVEIYYIGPGGDAAPVKVAEAQVEAVTITSNWSGSAALQALVERPRRWSPDAPHLYKAVVSVSEDGRVRDQQEEVFGIRTVAFDPIAGCAINGERVELQGVCMHHDLGPLGAAVNFRAIERQLELLQEMGCNAIRTAHNPPTPELLELCDRMGLVVIVEAFDCWAWGKTPNDYGRFFIEWHERDLEAMVKRDRNHPSVILWSSGNEIREQARPAGHEISRRLTDIIKRFDPTRLVTAGCNNPESGRNGFEQTVDVFGFNYKPHLYRKIHDINPNVPLYGSETASTVSSRGEFFFPVEERHSAGYQNFQVSSYDLYYPRWATTADREFEGQDRHAFVMGEFVWTGFDYLGEPTPYNPDATNALNLQDEAGQRELMAQLEKLGNGAPSRSSYFGIFDLCGFKKDRFYLYQSRWRPELPVAHILPHWNWPERVGKVTPVHVYTNGDEAELFLNGRSLGRRRRGEFEYRLRWDDVLYEAGSLRVEVYREGQPWAEGTVTTTGVAAALAAQADHTSLTANGQDLSFVTVKVVDAAGRVVPRTADLVRFSIEGPADIVAVGNGNAASHESFQADQRYAYNGQCLVIVRTRAGEAGAVTLRANADGLTGAVVKLTVEAGVDR